MKATTSAAVSDCADAALLRVYRRLLRLAAVARPERADENEQAKAAGIDDQE